MKNSCHVVFGKYCWALQEDRCYQATLASLRMPSPSNTMPLWVLSLKPCTPWASSPRDILKACAYSLVWPSLSSTACPPYLPSSHWVVCCLMSSSLSWQTVPVTADGVPVSDRPFTRTGLLGFIGPVSMTPCTRPSAESVGKKRNTPLPVSSCPWCPRSFILTTPACPLPVGSAYPATDVFIFIIFFLVLMFEIC